MKKIHYFLCPEHENHDPIVQLSFDGVQESKSSTTSLDTYCLKFNHCRTIYPIRIIRPCDRYKYDAQAEFQKVLDSMNENEIIIDCAEGDNPKRSFFRCAKCHGAKYACEYCENFAVFFIGNKKNIETIEKKYELQELKIIQEMEEIQLGPDNPTKTDQIQNFKQLLIDLKRNKKEEMLKNSRKQLTWPSSTMEGNLRTIDNINMITEEIESNPGILKTDPDFCKGIKGRSLLLNQPNFNILEDLTCEYMHLVCLGVVKRLTELTYKVGENRERVTKRKLSDPKVFNDLIRFIQLAREFSRRCRNMDFGVMKASEFRNLILFFFPIVLEGIEDEFEDEKKVWLHLVYMVRACVIPNNEFENVNKDLVQCACKIFYTLFEKCFGQKNCSYSIHVAPSHLLQIRGDMPLTFRSAFKFESFFFEMRQLFHPGTVSPLKQILQNCFVKRLLENHHCEKTTYFCAEKPENKNSKENNHLVYIYNPVNHSTTMYSIVEIINDNEFRCNIQGKFRYETPIAPEYTWSTVGIYRIGPISNQIHVIKRSDISGKVLKVQGLLITCPLNVLHEQ